MAAAKKKAGGRFTTFKLAGKTGKSTALDLSQASAIEDAGDGQVFVFIGSHRHVVATDQTLDELIAEGGDAAE